MLGVLWNVPMVSRGHVGASCLTFIDLFAGGSVG